MKYRCTRKIVKFGGSWAITLNKYQLPKKNFHLGDIVKVTIEHLESEEKILDRQLQTVAKEKGFSKVRILAEKNSQKDNQIKAGGAKIIGSSCSENKIEVTDL